jgi:hypothetical protein
MSDYKCEKSRRDFMKKVVYTAPVILTMTATPALANIGSLKRSGDEFRETDSSYTKHRHHHNNHHHWW